MDDSTRAELATLRARAYGPRADIGSDPAARARLHDLEAAERAARVAPEAASAVTAGDELDAGALLGLSTPDPPSAPDPPSGTAPRHATHRPVRVGWLVAWAASILTVAVAVGATVHGLAAIRPVSADTGARQIAALDEPIVSPEWLQSWFPTSDGSIVYAYRGLIIARTPTGVFSEGTDCIFVARANAVNETDGSIDGNIYTGCRAGEFPATLQFVVDASAPDELRAEFVDGTALQFVLVGDVVGVFTDDGASIAASPEA